MSNEWRRVAASLSDPVRRAVWASLVPRVDVSDHARERALRELTDAGLVVDGVATFPELLERVPVAVGVDRFLRDGRIAQWPANADDRRALLDWVLERLPHGEHDEKRLTDELSELSDDPVSLRRYLVDADYLIRSPDGSVYRVPARP